MILNGYFFFAEALISRAAYRQRLEAGTKWEKYQHIENGKGRQNQNLLIHAALHGSGHLLAKEIVASLKYVSEELRKEVIYSLGANVDVMRSSNYGCVVLKGLEL